MLVEQKKEHKVVDSFFFKDNLYFERKDLWKNGIKGGELIFIKFLLSGRHSTRPCLCPHGIFKWWEKYAINQMPGHWYNYYKLNWGGVWDSQVQGTAWETHSDT